MNPSLFPAPFLNSAFSEKCVMTPLVWKSVRVVREDKKGIKCSLVSLTCLTPPQDIRVCGR